ncbi:hypothetical protein [Ornithinibacillus halotolerans]|uniref:Uncharacterized protein n=1 Tax=Ornithinibacillus halotolerans TaxID=1274357 RepID=A0A916RND8_9BACI|nr:hypothetical protein [Ornithinibacillus halotolerans]GGA60440.1 hypothetical protein GCM10008025_00580 [Ornithinibacillus halotolerans]
MKDLWLEDKDNATVLRSVKEKDVVIVENLLGVKLLANTTHY